MNDEGYTATEALCALLILGLAFSGLSAGLAVIGKAQLLAGRRLSETVFDRTAKEQLSRLVSDYGPFRSDASNGFVGGRDGFRFPCEARDCRVQAVSDGLEILDPQGFQKRLRLNSDARLSFQYIGWAGQVDHWPPPSAPPPAPEWQVLKGIVVSRDGAAAPIAIVPISVDQAADCEFDVVIQDCRRASP